MAKKVTVQLVDDVDPTQHADKTIEFAVNKEVFELDLSLPNVEKFHEAIQPWVIHARRKNTSVNRVKAPGKQAHPRTEHQVIRDWCNANGWEVAQRGRIPVEALQAYEEFGGKKAVLA